MAPLPSKASAADLAQLRHPLQVLLTQRPHEADFTLFRHLPWPQGLFLDLGAHAGQSAASFHLMQPAWDILAFEPDPALAPSLRLLARLLRGRLRVRHEGVAERRGMATLLVPWAAGRRIPGEASFDRDSLMHHGPTRRRLATLAGGAQPRLRSIQRPVVRLDDLDLRPEAIKLDLQGGELAALRGMMATLERQHPLILMENNRHSRPIADLLEPLGYRPWNWDPGRQCLVAPANPFEVLNVVLVPEDKLRHLPR
jgi:FkbM family methyltransferase